MFEILTVLIMYARGSLEDRLKVLFQLYCFEEEESMQQDEFKFMLEKMGTSFGSTLSIKKTILLELVKASESKVVPEKEQILEKDFIAAMIFAIREFTIRLKDITERISIFNDTITKERMPAFL